MKTNVLRSILKGLAFICFPTATIGKLLVGNFSACDCYAVKRFRVYDNETLLTAGERERSFPDFLVEYEDISSDLTRVRYELYNSLLMTVGRYGKAV